MKAGVSRTIPVYLQATWGAYPGTSNVAWDTLTVWISKADGTTSVKALDATLWTQIQSFNMPGQYRLGFHLQELDQVGFFTLTIKGAAGVRQSNDRFELVTYADTDIQQREGALQTTMDAMNPLTTTIKQMLMGKQVLKLNTSPPKHIVYEVDGVTVLHQAEVEDTIEERRYSPL